MKKLLFIQLAIFVLTACGPVSTPTPTPFHELFYDCVLDRKAFVWADEDGDAIYDPEESPLQGIWVIIYPEGKIRPSFNDQTGPDGIAEITGFGDFGRGCDQLEVKVEVPSGFEPSTPTRFILTGLPRSDTLQFGLIPSMPTPTP